MNDIDINREILNLKIENILYPLVSLLKQTDKTELEIIQEITDFKERNKQIMFELSNEYYVEEYLNKIYSKRNNGEKLIEIQKPKNKKRKDKIFPLKLYFIF